MDIGCGISSLIPIDSISVSRISHPRDRFRIGQMIRAVVRLVDPDGRITLSHKELLGTWEENAALFCAGETVAGIIRSVEDYGVFIELAPNLAGLAEPREDVAPGQHASVYIKSLIPEKMKVKLIIVDAFDAQYQPEPLHYFYTGEHLDWWRYSPAGCSRALESRFPAAALRRNLRRQSFEAASQLWGHPSARKQASGRPLLFAGAGRGGVHRKMGLENPPHTGGIRISRR
ncbi:MAG: S1 RNA-binding domain-containing protein [Oscillospiraceae bacterium]